MNNVMLSIFAILASAICLSHGIVNLKDCTNYKPFTRSWICDESIKQFDHVQINKELDTRSDYNVDLYVEGTDKCVEDVTAPEPIIKPVKTRIRDITLEEVCRMEKIPIWNVFEDIEIGGRLERHECVVVNTNWMKQDLYYSRCTNPRTRAHDKCQLDYGDRMEFRCVQSGFVEKRVLVYCPSTGPRGDYIYITRKVPTTCSCRKCFHCDGSELLFADLLASLDDRFVPSMPLPGKLTGAC
ncbi:uncharacterized protein [Argopecten irradians]|uniref:uncharacterized protein n=1 Tax=Argopecten irradians TaxID=31199 RepID=UPI00371EEDCE